MRKNIIDIKAESSPWQIKLIGLLFLLGALMLFMNYWWLSLILAVVGLILITAYSGTEIDFATKTFREYNSYLFIRTGAASKYDKIERIFINQEQMATQTAHPSRLYFFNYVAYNAYLKFADGRKVFLVSRKDKSKLIKLLNPIATTLSVELSDNTM